MANTKSAIKRIRRISKQTVVNKARKSKFKNAIKKMNLLLNLKKKKRSFRFFTEVKFRINENF
jgi:small subunit ribosomal protein S20